MRLLVDGSGFVPGKALGAQTYLEGVLGGLKDRSRVSTVMLCGASAGTHTRQRFPWIETLEVDSIPQSAWKRAYWGWRNLNRVVARIEPDIVFFPFNIAHRVSAPSIVMVHDLVDLYYMRNFPAHHPLEHRMRYWAIRRGLRGVNRIITPSGVIAAEIVEVCPNTVGRIASIHEACSSCVPADGIEAPLDRVFPGEILLLVPSHCGPHKNVEPLIEVLAEITGERPEVGLGLKLIFTGRRNADYDRLERQASRLGIESLLAHTGLLSRPELVVLLNTVDAVVYPSLYEGFGLPVVEAQAAGRLLLLSDIPVLREVSGGRARFFTAGDPKSLKQQLVRLIDDLGQGGGVRPTPRKPRDWSAYMDDVLTEMEKACREWH